MTKPLYFWNGSSFELVGPTTPQSPFAYQTSAPTAPATGDIWIDSDGDVDTYNRQLTRYYFVATAGQTSVSGTDANGLTLAYVAGSEQVYVNGALQVRGVDYTATNGTSITGLSALALNDVVEVFAYTAFTVANAYTKSEVDSLIVGPAFAATSGALTVTNSTWTKIPFSGEVFDTNNNYDPTTNYRFTPTVAGYYRFTLSVFMGFASNRGAVAVYKNGSSAIQRLDLGSNNNGGISFEANGLLYMNGSTDYVEGYVYQESGGSVSINTDSTLTQFNGHLVRRA